MFNHTISAILRGSWLIEKGFADAHIPLVLGMLKGNLNGDGFLKGNKETESPFLINSNGKSSPAYVYDPERGVVLNNIEPNSIAVVPFIGPMVKYNGECGEPGMVKRQSWIKELFEHPNIVGLISLLDTPGGQADGTPQTASYIKSISKPTAAVILGGAYSAGAWIFAAHDFVYASDKYSQVGSIGAYTTVVDYSGYFEKEGLKLTEVYPDISKDKNISYRKAIAGDTSLIEKEIHALALSFREEFAAYREGKLTSDEWNTGKVFNAEDALRIGMIDGIMSLSEVAAQMISGSMVSQSAKVFAKAKHEINSQLNQSTNMKFTNVAALAGVQNATEAQLDLANADLATAGIIGATLVPDSFISDAAAVTTERDSLTSDLATANTTIANLQTEIEALKKGPGASHQPAGGEDDQPDLSQDEETEKILAAMPHNKTADALFG